MERYTKRLLKQKAPVLIVAALLIAVLLLLRCCSGRCAQQGGQARPAAPVPGEVCTCLQ